MVYHLSSLDKEKVPDIFKTPFVWSLFSRLQFFSIGSQEESVEVAVEVLVTCEPLRGGSLCCRLGFLGLNDIISVLPL